MVRTNTVIGPGGDAAVVRLRGTNKALALKTDCNGRYVYLEPRTGGRAAVAEAARNVACTGARPMAITNCLNFGNPKRPEVFYQFREAVGGMGDACRALGTPVTGGNVSLYNENPRGAVYPTPVVGMVGLIDDIAHSPARRSRARATQCCCSAMHRRVGRERVPRPPARSCGRPARRGPGPRAPSRRRSPRGHPRR